MDALTLLIVYLVTQNPGFQANLAPLCRKLKESQDMLDFLGSLSSFPCSPEKPDSPPAQDCPAPPHGTDCNRPCNDFSPDNPYNPCPPDPPRPTGTAGDCTGSSGTDGTHTRSAGTRTAETSPLRTLGGEWIEKYITKYLKN